MIVALVGFVAIASMLLISSVNHNDFSDSVGLAYSVAFPGYAVPISTINVDTNLIFNNASDVAPRLFDVSDDIIYRRAYVSYDGQSWQQFNLTPVGTLNGEWIYTKGVVNALFTPVKLNLNTARTSSNNTYIIVYSCSKNTTIHNWSCHDGWQIIKFDAKLNFVTPSIVSPVVTLVSPTPSSGSTITTSSQRIVADITGDSSSISSWIDFDKSLIGYWSMDYYSTAGIYDNSSYKNFGTFNGGLSTGNIVTGVRGKGLSFDGIDDSIAVTDITPRVSNSITISAWVKFNQSVATDSWDEAIIIKNDFYGLERITGSNVIGLYIKDNSDSTHNSDVLSGIQNTWTPGQWYHIVVVANSTIGRIYINGVLDNSGPIMWDPYSLTSAIYIGGNADYMAQTAFKGSLDEVMIFNRTLSASEVSALYNSKVNKFDATITGLTNGQHNYNVYAIDDSGNLVSSGQRTLTVNAATTCTPSCTNKQCGSDGCVGSCGTCASPQTCGGGGTANVCGNTVVTPTCFDGIQNQGEIGIDCGGPCTACQTSTGTTYYVSASIISSDSNSGTQSSPWKTLSHACLTVKTSGSIIHVTTGIYTESSQCSLAPGVSIEGEGSTSTTIKSSITSAPTIYLYSSSVTNGNQHISNIKMDGNNLVAYEPIVIDKRSNVEVHDCVFVNFYFSGVSFFGENLGEDIPPNNFCLNNKFYNNVITNCASFNVEGSPGNLQVDGQQGMRVYNNVITQTARGAGADGFGIKCVQGLNKDMKVYNNTITIDNDDEAQFDFAMEFWDSLGGIEIYDNRVQGVIDLAGHFGRKGNYSYTYSVHDNILGPDSLKTTSRHGIYLENTNDLSDIYIYNNRLQNLNNPIKIETWKTASFSNIQIYYNVFYNVGLAGEGWNTNGFSEGNQPGFTLDNLKFYNNVFIAATVAGAKPISAIQIPGKGTTTNVEIKNNIIMNFNSAISTGYSGGTIRGVTIANNILYNNGATISWDGTKPTAISESNTIISNPLFNSPTDFHLQKGSPAIDKGINVGLTSDYAGTPVPQGTAPDIGAYEYYP